LNYGADKRDKTNNNYGDDLSAGSDFCVSNDCCLQE
jgi:hypothetical protein